MFTHTGVQNVANTVRDIRHDLLPNFSEDYLFEGTDFDSTPNKLYIGLPQPIHTPFKCSKIDPVKELLEEKREYFKLLEIKRRRYKIDRKRITTEKVNNREYMNIPKHLVDFFQNKDPDFYFRCDYNYYYTDGFLENINIDNENYLIRPDIQSNLCLTNLRDQQCPLVLNSDISDSIFNINAIKSSDSHLLLLRGKYNLNIATISGIERVNKIWTNKYEIPLVDAKLNNENHKWLGVIDSDRKFSIRDIEKEEVVLTYDNKSYLESDNFQKFQFVDENIIALCDRFQIKFIDYRTSNVEKLFHPKVLECNSLCNFKIVNDKIYTASRHYLIKSDTRAFENISCFSHTLNSPPCYMDFVTKDDDTFLCLAGQNQRDKVLFTGKSMFGLPYKVPGIHNTLKECRLKNSRLVLYDTLDERLDYCVAGLKMINLNNKVFIYSANSLGEIFQQKISKKDLNLRKPVEALTNWVNGLENNPILHLTCVENMSRARFALNVEPIKSNLDKYKDSDTAQSFLHKFGSIYKNVPSKLVQHFLEVWEDDEDQDEEEEVEELPEVPVIDKVNDWIKTQDFEDNTKTWFLNSKSE